MQAIKSVGRDFRLKTSLAAQASAPAHTPPLDSDHGGGCSSDDSARLLYDHHTNEPRDDRRDRSYRHSRIDTDHDLDPCSRIGSGRP
jgi:hypothetical protein